MYNSVSCELEEILKLKSFVICLLLNPKKKYYTPIRYGIIITCFLLKKTYQAKAIIVLLLNILLEIGNISFTFDVN
jgi:hypothetical protein